MYNKILLLLIAVISPNLLADNRSNQMNPNNSAYYSSRGISQGSASSRSGSYYNRNNRSNQMNPNNSAYYSSRGISQGSASSRSGSYYNRNNRSNQLNPNNNVYYSSRGILKNKGVSTFQFKQSLPIKFTSGNLSIKTKDGMDSLFINNKEMSIKERFIEVNKVTGFYGLYLLELNPGGSGTNTYYQFLVKNKKRSFNKTKSFGSEWDLNNLIISPEKSIVILQFSKHYFRFDKIPKDKKIRERIIKTIIYKDGNLVEKDGDIFSKYMK